MLGRLCGSRPFTTRPIDVDSPKKVIFNCGVGMIAVVPESQVGEVIAHLEKHRISTWKIGTVETSSEPAPFVEWR